MNSNSRIVREQSRCDSCQQKTLKIDLYRQPFRLRLPDNSDYYKTMLGSILSIITIVSLLTYTAVQLQVMYAREDYVVQLRDELDYFSPEDSFGREQGFFVAFGLASLDSMHVELDPSIGEIHFYQRKYDVKGAMIASVLGDKPFNITSYKRLDEKPCKPSDFLETESPYMTRRTGWS